MDISRIQETHETNATDMEIGAYTIYNTPAPKTDKGEEPGNMKGGGGIAIIRTDLTTNIKEVTKRNEQLMHMRIQTEKQTNNILLINSYAPHMGYKADVRRDYWWKLKQFCSKKMEMNA